MRRMMWLFAVAVAATLSATVATRAHAQEGWIVGTILRDSSGHVLQAARIDFPDLKRSVLSNAMGEFRITGVPAGKHAVVVRHTGFKAYSDTVSVTAGAHVDVEYILTEGAVQLDSVVVNAPEKKFISPGLNEFEERRKINAGGYFISDSLLRKSDDRNFLEVISSYIPGLRRYQPDFRDRSKWYVSSSRKCGNGPARQGCNTSAGCPPSLFIDGVVVFNAASQGDDVLAVPDFTKFTAREYSGVEVYLGASAVPAKYNMTGNGCGVILLWSRER